MFRWLSKLPDHLLECLLVLLIGSGCSSGPETEVWVIGLDGADWDVLEPLMARGDLPNLSQLRREGAWGVLRSDEPMLSPILWTSIATGKTADLHGVTWFMSDGPDGTKVPVSSQNRRVRSFWNVASERGKRVGVIGWWATWPAEPVEGFVVSDYLGWHSFGVSGRALDVPGKTWPADLLDEVQSAFPPRESIDVALLQQMVHLPADRLQYDASASPYGEPLLHLRQALATSRGYTAFTLRRLEQERPDLLAVYYEGTDAVEHLFSAYTPPRLPWISQDDFEAYRDVVRGYWRWQDQILGELLAKRTEHTTVVVVSDHGFRTGDERLREEHFDIDRADASHMLDGIVLLHGPNIRPGTRLTGADIYDVAPTVLYLLGLPVADDLTGDVLFDAFDEAYRTSHPVSTVATYETGDWDRGQDLVADPAAGEQMEEMLRSLGYIGGGTAGDGEVSGNVEQAINLAVVLRRQHRHDEAAAALREVLQEIPDHVEARTNLAQVLAEQGRLDEAQALYQELVGDQPGNLEHREDLALAQARRNDVAGALATYEAGLALDPQWVIGLAGKGFALHNLGRSQEGLAILDQAYELDSRHAEVLYYRGVVLRSLGRDPEAIGALGRALQLDPTLVAACRELSALREAQGDLAEAMAVVERTEQHVEADPTLVARHGELALKMGALPVAVERLAWAAEALPDNPTVAGNYGLALLMSGNVPAAAAQFEKVIELDPQSEDAYGQLGAIYLQLGQPERALELLKKAVEIRADRPQLHFTLGSIYHRLGRLDEAKPCYETAMRLDPRNGLYPYMLGMVLGEQGEETRALELIERGRHLDPSLPAPGADPQAGPR